MVIDEREFDVFVSEGALVEVWRGEHITNAQVFGVDWNGGTSTVLHPATFDHRAYARLKCQHAEEDHPPQPASVLRRRARVAVLKHRLRSVWGRVWPDVVYVLALIAMWVCHWR